MNIDESIGTLTLLTASSRNSTCFLRGLNDAVRGLLDMSLQIHQNTSSFIFTAVFFRGD